MLSLADIQRAREQIADAIYLSPLARSESLSQRTGNTVFLKLENLQMTGSFKERGAQYRMQALSGVERQAGIIASSAGNHAQAVAYVAQQLGIRATIVMPVHAPLTKLVNTRGYGAEVILAGETYADAYAVACEHQSESGQVFVHPFDHQMVMAGQGTIGLELLEQQPDLDAIIAPVGGGGLIGGIAVAIKEQAPHIEVIGVEPASCPTLTKGPFVYDIGDMSGMTPLMAMYSLGHTFVPPPIHAGGLRYHGMAPMVSHAVHEGLASARSIHQLECYGAAVEFAKTEGIIVAPETSHAVAAAIQEAKKAKEEGKEKVIIFNLSGHGLMDLKGYEAYFGGELQDYELPTEVIEENLKALADYPKP